MINLEIIIYDLDSYGEHIQRTHTFVHLIGRFDEKWTSLDGSLRS